MFVCQYVIICWWCCTYVCLLVRLSVLSIFLHTRSQLLYQRYVSGILSEVRISSGIHLPQKVFIQENPIFHAQYHVPILHAPYHVPMSGLLCITLIVSIFSCLPVSRNSRLPGCHVRNKPVRLGQCIDI